MDLHLIWFILLGVLLTGYAILDGFDLGVGALHLFARTDRERRLMLNSIGPVWDGNEVWLVTGGGALFAAFPDVYATLASGFYLAVYLLIFCLIFRAVAIEFRSKRPGAFWRRSWDVAFCVSSILSAFLFGVVIGNLIWGVPLGADKEFHGTFLGLLNPYALLTGLTVVAVCMMHGSIYVVMKTQGDFHDRVRDWVRNSIIFFVIMYVTLTMATLLYVPHMVQNFKDYPLLFIIPIANLLLIANIPREIYHKKDFLAFLSSCGAMAILMFLFGFGIFPDLVLSNPHPEFSLNIYQDSSSLATLHIMLIIAMIGMPLVVAYTVSIYWIFRGKVSIDDHSY
ncbi:MAG: cytochrome d ubiquinol oxidase subunit II [Candidatus Omnitrophica bacterium]|nr:cytochrome d ubiquinol oxidase subunit II [Candidatus Omnitrophota bacterium]MDE2008675.1 cytochrome d ubiquinol oxidase subunit II [Candidatus Omnitrophota bacterium]